MHLTVATNGTLCTPEKVREMVDAGLRYAEISLDSVDPAKHDAWRGSAGYWDRAVAGIRNVVKTPGIKCGVAMTVTRWNLADLEPMLEWCIAEGVDTFYAFNFIPTGRAKGVADQDLSPPSAKRCWRSCSGTWRTAGSASCRAPRSTAARAWNWATPRGPSTRAITGTAAAR